MQQWKRLPDNLSRIGSEISAVQFIVLPKKTFCDLLVYTCTCTYLYLKKLFKFLIHQSLGNAEESMVGTMA